MRCGTLTGEEETITVSDDTEYTTSGMGGQESSSSTGNSSRGLDATYGGTVNATNVNITTEGAHCAPIATD